MGHNPPPPNPNPLPTAVLVRRGPDGKAQLVLLDHGLYEFLSER